MITKQDLYSISAFDEAYVKHIFNTVSGKVLKMLEDDDGIISIYCSVSANEIQDCFSEYLDATLRHFVNEAINGNKQ